MSGVRYVFGCLVVLFRLKWFLVFYFFCLFPLLCFPENSQFSLLSFVSSSFFARYYCCNIYARRIVFVGAGVWARAIVQRRALGAHPAGGSQPQGRGFPNCSSWIPGDWWAPGCWLSFWLLVRILRFRAFQALFGCPWSWFPPFLSSFWPSFMLFLLFSTFLEVY